MQFLLRKEIRGLLEGGQLFVDPLLDQRQVGEVSLDLRLGYDFLVSTITRSPYISLDSTDPYYRSAGGHFNLTRRDLGERFVLYPHTTVLSTSLEYIALPNNIYMDVLTRSSFNRLGITVNTMLHPGFCSCVPMELFNHGTSPVELIVGSRIVQARLIRIAEEVPGTGRAGPRKYVGNVRPTPSRAQIDEDLAILLKASSVSKY